MFVVYFLFDTFFWKPRREEALKATQSNELIDADTDKSDERLPEIDFESADSELSDQKEATELFLENENIRVGFSSRGATISSIVLKNFDFSKDEKVDLVPESGNLMGLRYYHDQSGTDLSASIFDFSLDEENSKLSFYLGEKDNENFLVSYELDELYGIKSSYLLSEMGSLKGLRLSLDAGIADSETNTKSKAQDYRFYLNGDNKVEKFPLSKMKKKQPAGAMNSFAFCAVRSKYFTLALREDEPALSRSFAVTLNPQTGNPGFSIDSFHSDGKNSWEQSFVLYAGPADATILKQYGKQMEEIAERGANWLRWLSSFFVWFLNLLHRYIKNYGVVVIILAFLLKLALHPLTNSSMKASMKMQELQPQINALQAKYKNDPQMLQSEMSKLYKDAGASPLSGCLPLLLQMPIFISLYNALRYSLDMRNAGFVFWIKDLSEPDPYLVLPILMGVFMVIQSLMMQPKQMDTKNMDEKQKAAQSSQKMMTWMMPIMMFFIFKNMPSGLVLYWTVFNIFTVIQQYYLRKSYNKD